jgi:hypothetical protein
MSDWISVRDRLPEDGEEVLIFIRDFDSVSIGELFNGIFLDHVKLLEIDDFVTHWQLLPEPPRNNNES